MFKLTYTLLSIVLCNGQSDDVTLVQWRSSNSTTNKTIDEEILQRMMAHIKAFSHEFPGGVPTPADIPAIAGAAVAVGAAEATAIVGTVEEEAAAGIVSDEMHMHHKMETDLQSGLNEAMKNLKKVRRNAMRHIRKDNQLIGSDSIELVDRIRTDCKKSDKYTRVCLANSTKHYLEECLPIARDITYNATRMMNALAGMPDGGQHKYISNFRDQFHKTQKSFKSWIKTMSNADHLLGVMGNLTNENSYREMQQLDIRIHDAEKQLEESEANYKDSLHTCVRGIVKAIEKMHFKKQTTDLVNEFYGNVELKGNDDVTEIGNTARNMLGGLDYAMREFKKLAHKHPNH